jgi:hypothetical protein
MDESKPAVTKQPKRAPNRLLWIAILSIVIGSLAAVISLLLLAQPGNEENLWALLAIPALIVGGCVTFVGVVLLIVNGALRGSRQAEPSDEVKGS